MSSYRYSSEANKDIEEIALYFFELNPTAAYNFINRLEETCQRLADHPGMGRMRPEFGEELRSFPLGNYLVFYMQFRMESRSCGWYTVAEICRAFSSNELFLSLLSLAFAILISPTL